MSNHLIFLPLGYLCGSLTPSIWITRYIKGIDVRDAGSGHATTTNTIRQVGWLAGAIVLIIDILKGFAPVYLAQKYTGEFWVIAATAALAVAGHCWPLFAGFRGGMGLATTGGALFAVDPLAVAVGLSLLLVLVLVIHHSARASVFTGILLSSVFWILGYRGSIIWVSTAAGLVIAVRFLSDWGREYKELWLDRDQPTPLRD